MYFTEELPVFFQLRAFLEGLNWNAIANESAFEWEEMAMKSF